MKHLILTVKWLITLLFVMLLFNSCDWKYRGFIENNTQDTIKITYYVPNEKYNLVKNPKTYNSVKDIDNTVFSCESFYDTLNYCVTSYLAPDKLLCVGDFVSYENPELSILNSNITIEINDSVKVRDYELYKYGFVKNHKKDIIFSLSPKTLGKINKNRNLDFKGDTIFISYGKDNSKPSLKYIPSERKVIEYIYYKDTIYHKEIYVNGRIDDK